MANYNIAAFRRGKNQDLSTQKPRSQSMPQRLRRKGIANIGVIALAGGLVATLALPAYAFTPDAHEARTSATAATELTRTNAQAVNVPTLAATITITRDGFTATTPEELAARARAKAAAAAAAASRKAAAAAAASRKAAATTASASRKAAAATVAPTASVAAAPAPSSAGSSVFAVAARFQGVPYLFGGASPRGFDCSGLVKYVWAQFGKNLPHSSNAQAAMGTRISRADAKPGDLVVIPGHIGFYAGNGKILHAPYPGQSVRIQPIWTSNYYIVRL
ncbi:MAG: C40 family peptidase [Cryobacterium sp.]